MCLQHKEKLKRHFECHPWESGQGSALHITRVPLILLCPSGMAALGSPELPAPLQPASSILAPQPLGKATFGLLGLRMEELGSLSELRLTLMVMATLKITLLWSECDSRTPFLWRVCHCSKRFARRTLSTKSGLSAHCQKTVVVCLKADT